MCCDYHDLIALNVLIETSNVHGYKMYVYVKMVNF